MLKIRPYNSSRSNRDRANKNIPEFLNELLDGILFIVIGRVI